MTDAQDVVLIRDITAERSAVRVLSINRPHRRNAMNTAVLERLRAGLVAADDDPDISAVVITGEGEHLSGGGDLDEFAGVDDSVAKLARARSMADLFLLSRRIGIPVVAAARGAAVGGGAALALSADMVVAGDDLRLGFPELVRSITPTTAMVGLARQLGSRLAFEMLVTGRFLAAQEALTLGLVNRVVEAERTLDAAVALAATVSGIDGDAMRTTKQLFYRGQELTDGAAMDVGVDALREQWFAGGQGNL